MATKKSEEKKSVELGAEAKSADPIKKEDKTAKTVKPSRRTKTASKTPSKKTPTRAKKLPTEKVEKKVEKVTPVEKELQDSEIQTRDRGAIILGAGLLLMGVLLLGGRLLHIPFGDFIWPFIFIIPGGLVFLTSISSESSSGEGLAILGGILGMLGLVFLMQSVTGFWASWAYIWALVAPTSIGLSQMVYGNIKNRDAIAVTGWKLTKIGATILVIGFIFFELILGISGFGLARFGLPVFPMILIFTGVFVLIRSLFGSK